MRTWRRRVNVLIKVRDLWLCRLPALQVSVAAGARLRLAVSVKHRLLDGKPEAFRMECGSKAGQYVSSFNLICTHSRC
jgi:hypothetical protein